MEAVAYGQQAHRFNNELQIGEVYVLRGVGFQRSDMPPPFGLVIPTEYYAIMHTLTQIHLPINNVSIPRLPSLFMEFHDAATLRNKKLTGAYHFLFNCFTLSPNLDYAFSNFDSFSDVIGIVVHVSPIRFHKSFDRNTPCRDVVLMNIR